MNTETKRRIHAFRNALVLAADTCSHECFAMGRWRSELNAFPHGCCDLASNFLAQYLQDSDPALRPVVLHMQTTPEFRCAEKSTIKTHVIVEVAGWFVDLTLNQFAEYKERVVIDNRTGVLGTLRRKIPFYGGSLEERDIQLDSVTEEGSELYAWLRATADSLLASPSPSR
jgi:hypothetical protein